jgi:hypothetical protein
MAAAVRDLRDLMFSRIVRLRFVIVFAPRLRSVLQGYQSEKERFFHLELSS